MGLRQLGGMPIGDSERMIRCGGLRLALRSVCCDAVYHCRHCGSTGCQKLSANDCTGQAFLRYMCLKCGMVGGRGQAMLVAEAKRAG